MRDADVADRRWVSLSSDRTRTLYARGLGVSGSSYNWRRLERDLCRGWLVGVGIMVSIDRDVRVVGD